VCVFFFLFLYVVFFVVLVCLRTSLCGRGHVLGTHGGVEAEGGDGGEGGLTTDQDIELLAAALLRFIRRGTFLAKRGAQIYITKVLFGVEIVAALTPPCAATMYNSSWE